MVPLAEIFLLIYLGNAVGYYFTLALAAASLALSIRFYRRRDL